VDDGVSQNTQEESHDLMFKVFLYNPIPEAVRISKKNICIVHVNQRDKEVNDAENEKMLNYFLAVREPTWGQ